MNAVFTIPMSKYVIRSKGKPAPDVYIGRPSKWGNPFTHLDKDTLARYKVSTREESIQEYAKWVLQQPSLMAQILLLRGKTLGCWCRPQACHGDVLAALANYEPKYPLQKEPWRCCCGAHGLEPECLCNG